MVGWMVVAKNPNLGENWQAVCAVWMDEQRALDFRDEMNRNPISDTPGVYYEVQATWVHERTES